MPAHRSLPRRNVWPARLGWQWRGYTDGTSRHASQRNQHFRIHRNSGAGWRDDPGHGLCARHAACNARAGGRRPAGQRSRCGRRCHRRHRFPRQPRKRGRGKEAVRTDRRIDHGRRHRQAARRIDRRIDRPPSRPHRAAPQRPRERGGHPRLRPGFLANPSERTRADDHERQPLGRARPVSVRNRQPGRGLQISHRLPCGPGPGWHHRYPHHSPARNRRAYHRRRRARVMGGYRCPQCRVEGIRLPCERHLCRPVRRRYAGHLDRRILCRRAVPAAGIQRLGL